MIRGLKVCSSSVALLLCCVSTALAAKFTATLDRTTIEMGDTATLSLVFEGGMPQNVPTPKVSDLDISNTGNSTSFTFTNGRMSSVITVTFSINPRQTGDFVIPAMETDVGGQRVYTQPLKLKVVKPGTAGVSKIKPCSPVASMRPNVSSALATNFTATLDCTTIEMGETATLSLTSKGGQPQNVPTPEVPGLEITNTGTSSSYSFVNGQMSSVDTVTFSINPRQTGDFVIPAMEADIGGQRFYTRPLNLQVVKPGVLKIKPGSQVAFMRLVLPARKVYHGETVAGQLQFFLRDDVQREQGVQMTAIPANGFRIGKMAQGGIKRAQIGNRTYTVIPASFALTAVKTGPLSVGPFSANIQIVVADTNGQWGPFASFFGGQQKQISLVSDPVSVTSLPLPTTDVPPGFNGAVGDFRMTASAGPTNVAVGDPVTLRVQISGRGSLDSIALPSQTDWSDFKLFPPTSKTETSDDLGDEGSRTFEEIVTPQNANIHELPPISFSFFNPDDGNYHTLTRPATPLFVSAVGAGPTPREETPGTTSK